MGGYFNDEKWKTFLTDSVEPIAKGTWSSQQEDPSWQGGLRRYAAAKVATKPCEMTEDHICAGELSIGSPIEVAVDEAGVGFFSTVVAEVLLPAGGASKNRGRCVVDRMRGPLHRHIQVLHIREPIH